MTAHLIDGKLIAKQVRQHVTSYVESLTQAGKRQPGLAVVLVGSDAASQVYVSNKPWGLMGSRVRLLVWM